MGGASIALADGKGGTSTSATSAAKGGSTVQGTGKGGATPPADTTGKGGTAAPPGGATAPAPTKGGNVPPASPSSSATTPGSGGGTQPASRGSTGTQKGGSATGGSTGSGGGTGTTLSKGHSTVIAPGADPAPSVTVTPPGTRPTTKPPPTHHRKPPTHRHHRPHTRTTHHRTGSGTGTGTQLPILLAAGRFGLIPAGYSAKRHPGGGAVSGRADGSAHGLAGAPALVAREIGHVVRVVPAWAWAIVGLMLALLLVSASATARMARRLRRSEGLVGSMRTAAVTDPLTGLLNRRGFTDRLERELARARRFGHPLAVAFLDVRGLKAVNDDHGHSAGDAVLQAAAQLVRSATREQDIVGRIGGDECAVALIEQDRAGAVAFARRIAAAVPNARDELGTVADWDVTVGVAVFPEDGETSEELLSAADRRLYLRRGIALSATRTPKE